LFQHKTLCKSKEAPLATKGNPLYSNSFVYKKLVCKDMKRSLTSRNKKEDFSTVVNGN
jgi:hypothetical protein